MTTELFKFQKEDVERINSFGGNCLLANQMGLGKTITVLTYLKQHPELRPALIVCPASIKYGWQDQAREHYGMGMEVLSGMKPDYARLVGRSIVCCNYDILHKWVDAITRWGPKIIIADECHYCANPTTRRTKAVRHLVKQAGRMIAVSGTAITSRPIQMWPVLNMLHPQKFKSHHMFGIKFCGARYKFGRWDYSGATRVKMLHNMLTKLCMIRRRKEDVLDDLPEKQRIVVPLELPAAALREYQAAESETGSWLRGNYRPGTSTASQALVKIGELRRLASKLKMPLALEWVKEFLDGGEKLIAFSVHRRVSMELAEAHGESCEMIIGDTPARLRNLKYQRFNKDKKCRLIAGNIQAAGTGWSASACSAVAFMEMAWTPGEHEQAADRIHGIGRGEKGRGAQAFWLVAKGTIEEKMCKLLDRKQATLNQVLDGLPADTQGIHDLLIQSIMKGEKS